MTASAAPFDTSANYAAALDAADPLRTVRAEFEHPFRDDGRPFTYLCGNSLGLMPRTARVMVQEELEDWSRLAV
jgi:kynureninase